MIEGLRVDAIIGVHERERTRPQQVVIDISLQADITVASQSDNLADTVSYGDVARWVTAYVENSSFELIEALAENLATGLLQQFSVAAIRIKVAKPGAVANADQVAVVIERSQH